MKVLLELRAGEGGDDAKSLVQELGSIYLLHAEKNCCTAEIIRDAKGWLNLLIEGPDSQVAPLLREAGGHRWERVPPNEKRGRVHSSTVTVAAFEVLPEQKWQLNDSDVLVFTTKDTGPGGQHRNKTESCVVMRHIPTGIEAKASTKSQFDNKKTARAMLEARVESYYREIRMSAKHESRKQMVGSGMRGDKIRTYREQDDQANDHVTGKRVRLKDVRKGGLSKLW